MISASQRYLKNNNLLPEYSGESVVVSLETLIEKNLIKSPSKLLGDDSCSGTVVVRLNGTSEYGADSLKMNYLPNLKCKNYNSKNLLSYIMSDVTTSGSGLYELPDGYIYKGNKVNNYVSFYGHIYRIMSVDSSGIVKLIKNESEPITRIWDNKYNIEADRSYGISNYADSSIMQGLLDDYNNRKKISLQAREHVVAHDVCIGKRSSTDFSISLDSDCQELITNQLISIPNVSDFAMASLDPNCNSIISKSCKNYNYLSGVLVDSWTTTGVTDNTYQVYYIGSSLSYLDNANEHHTYNIIIYIDGNEFVKSGDGKKSSPYIIE